MPDSCPKHPDRPSAGTCKTCGKSTCPVCLLDVDGALYCSLGCFTESSMGAEGAPSRTEPRPGPPSPPGPAPADPSEIVPTGQAFEDVWSRLEQSAQGAPSADPLAGIGLDASSGSMPKAPPPAAAGEDEPSVMMSAAQADLVPESRKDDSSIITPAASGDEGTSILEMDTLRKEDGTSVLDMGAVRQLRDASDQIGSSALLDAVKKDNTSILGMGAIAKPQGAAERMPFVIPDPPAPEESAPPAPVPDEARRSSLEDPPGNETPLPMILPGTRRSTIQAACVFHPELPAVVLCSRCGDAICTLCVIDEEHGGRCSPHCRRDDPRRKNSRTFGLLLGATAAAAVAGAIWLFTMAGSETATPKPEPTPVAISNPEPPPPLPPKPELKPEPKPELKPEPKPEPKPELKPEPPPPPPPPPKPEPPPSLHLAFLRDPWGHEKAGSWYRVRTTVGGKDAYRDVGLREIGPGYRVLVSQASADGKTEPEIFTWTEPEEVSIFGSVNGEVQGKKYTVDVVQSKLTKPSRYVFRDAPFAGAYFPSDAVLARLDAETVKVKDREFACTVLGTEPKDGKKGSTTWFSPEVPLAAVRWEVEGATGEIIDFGADWTKRPAFPAPPTPVVVVPPPPPPPPPAPPPPPPAKSTVELALESASLQIREATPVFAELADELDPATMPAQDVRRQLERAEGVERLLRGARADYQRILSEAPDRAKVEWRIQVLGELIETLQWGLDRVKVPRMLRQASVRVAEAVPLYSRVAAGRGAETDASERAALETMRDLALSKLKEARSLFVQARPGSGDEARIGLRIQSLDLLIDALEGGPTPAQAAALVQDASAKIQQATPLYQKVSEGRGTAEDAAASRRLLWDARSDYLRAQAGATGADAEALGAKIRSLDQIIEALDGDNVPKK